MRVYLQCEEEIWVPTMYGGRININGGFRWRIGNAVFDKARERVWIFHPEMEDMVLANLSQSLFDALVDRQMIRFDKPSNL